MTLRRKGKAAWLRLRPIVFSAEIWLLLPLACLVFLFYEGKVGFHSDDISYWMAAEHWKHAFEQESFGSALRTIFYWPDRRPAFHPLLGVPALWICRGSIDAAVIFIGVVLSLVISISLFAIFRLSGFSKRLAVLAAVAVATFPHFLTQGRFFMSEFPLAAFCLTALAFLLAERYALFFLFYALALLERPLEGSLLMPAFFLFVFLRRPAAQRIAYGKTAMAAAGAFTVAILAYSGRINSFLPWISRTSFGKNGIHVWRNLKIEGGTVTYILKSFFDIFGITGAVVVLGAVIVILVGAKKKPRNLIFYFGVLAMLVAIFFLISCFDNSMTVATVWRYSLEFVLFSITSAILMLERSSYKRLTLPLVGVFLAANIFTIASGFAEWAAFENASWAFSVRYHHGIFHDTAFPLGIEEVVDQLVEILPAPSGSILFVGRSYALQGKGAEFSLRCGEKLHTDCMCKMLEPDYLGELFRRDLQEGAVDISKYGIGAVVFARELAKDDLAVRPFPNEELFQIFKSGKENRLGFVLLGRISTGFMPGPKVLEVFGKRLQ